MKKISKNAPEIKNERGSVLYTVSCNLFYFFNFFFFLVGICFFV